ncbi:MAG: hypothetical protein HYR56_11505 [Acidobacteria bacterium]|nr:hypothetical protein [Acidobacteriota bacterium]MBI3428444.1 hypothetical protein [Acidobacteriota bacterium]
MAHGMNYWTLLVFAPVLVLVGVLGFVIPVSKALTSGAAPYNIFHIIFGLLGLALVCSGNEAWYRDFNLVFGLIDLYQAVASFANLFPKAQFKWTRADDVLHVVIGAALVLIGLCGS